jgi:hypothetical protein
VELPLPPSPLADLNLTIPSLHQEPAYSTDSQFLYLPLRDEDEEDFQTEVAVSTSLHRLSWSYYTSDIKIKQLQCRLLNALYRDGPQKWTWDRVPHMVRIAEDLEAELDVL